jgi:sulfate permease, SulP family
MAQGIANVVAPLFGGMPATSTIAHTITNVRAGTASPVSGLVHVLTLVAVVLGCALFQVLEVSRSPDAAAVSCWRG